MKKKIDVEEMKDRLKGLKTGRDVLIKQATDLVHRLDEQNGAIRETEHWLRNAGAMEK